jgi:hypothetical protein
MLEAFAGCVAGLVVDDSERPGARCAVEAIDVPAQAQPGVQGRFDVELTFGRLESSRVLEGEVPPDELLGAGQPTSQRRAVRVVVEQRGDLGLDREQFLPLRIEQGNRMLGSALGRRQVEQALEHCVHHSAAGSLGARPLRETVDRPEAIQERTGHEIGCARRREGQPDGRLLVGGGRCCPHGGDSRTHPRQSRM